MLQHYEIKAEKKQPLKRTHTSDYVAKLTEVILCRVLINHHRERQSIMPLKTVTVNHYNNNHRCWPCCGRLATSGQDQRMRIQNPWQTSMAATQPLSSDRNSLRLSAEVPPVPAQICWRHAASVSECWTGSCRMDEWTVWSSCDQ